jgi:hypothetical protein
LDLALARFCGTVIIAMQIYVRQFIIEITREVILPIDPLPQNRLGKVVIVISVIFVLLFASAVLMHWLDSPESLNPVFG